MTSKSDSYGSGANAPMPDPGSMETQMGDVSDIEQPNPKQRNLGGGAAAASGTNDEEERDKAREDGRRQPQPRYTHIAGESGKGMGQGKAAQSSSPGIFAHPTSISPPMGNSVPSE